MDPVVDEDGVKNDLVYFLFFFQNFDHQLLDHSYDERKEVEDGLVVEGVYGAYPLLVDYKLLS